MFTQERQAVHRADGGLGLGLTIVKSLVELSLDMASCRIRNERGPPDSAAISSSQSTRPQLIAVLERFLTPEPAN